MMAKRPSPNVAQQYHVPAPIGGLNTVAAGLAMPEIDCVQAVNLISAENGLRSRLGYREWCTGLVGTTADYVRSMLPFSGSQIGNSRLFATTEVGIYDVSASSVTPPLAFSFVTQLNNAGYGSSAVVVTSAGHFLLYCDEENGLHVYTELGGTWSQVTMGAGANQIANVDPASFVYVSVFKGRVWFVQRDTADAWYLPAGQIFGAATKFPFGGLFREGGTLVGLYNWTYDGGAGLDDSLVVVSTGGDVLVYQGTDPASASTFGLKGVWQIGAPPTGRRIASTYGGDLLLLSRQGLVPMSRLVVGAAGAVEYATAKIANLVNSLMLEKASLRDWGVVLQPEDNALMILVPRGTSGAHLQLAQSVASKGWFTYRDLPILSAAPWEGKLYFGTQDGRVCVHTGYIDGQSLSDPDSFSPVQWQVLGAFSNLGSARWKRVNVVRPLILSDTQRPSFSAEARHDYNQTEIDPVALALGGTGTWDSAIWDQDVWGGGAYSTLGARGATGTGVSVAVAIRGTAIGRTVLVGTDVSFTMGGFL